MLKWLTSLFSIPKQPPKADSSRFTRLYAEYRKVKAAYDAALTSEDLRRHWGNVDSLSAAWANREDVRRVLRDRSRYEYGSNGYMAGIIRTRADDLVGKGPTLQILTDDDTLSEGVEKAFAGWARAVDLPGKLRTMDQARCRDGEAFALLTTNPKLSDAVKLDLRLIEADQIADPLGSGALWREGHMDGIEYDKAGNPVWYSVLRYHPGDMIWKQNWEADRYPADSVLHWFRRDRPGQLRGIPELTPSLPLFAILRRWTLASLTAAETAANFSAVLETEAPPDGETDEPNPFETLEIERNMMTTLPAGTKLHQFAAEHPASQYSDFKREVLGEAARPVSQPLNVAMMDSSKANFSSARLDHLLYRNPLEVDRSQCERDILERVFLAWYEEASLIPGYLPAAPEGVDLLALRRAWYWPGFFALDKEEAKNDTERLNNGTATLSELLAAWGQDWREVVRQRGKEVKFMEANGVTPAAPAPGGPGGGGFGASAAGNGHVLNGKGR